MTSIIQFFKFALVGFLNTIIYWLVYYSLALMNIPWFICSTLGFVVSVINSFFWNNKYVFKKEEGEERKLKQSFVKVFLANAVSGLLVNNMFLFLWIDLLNISLYIAPIINLFITVPINFLMNKHWAFGKKKDRSDYE